MTTQIEHQGNKVSFHEITRTKMHSISFHMILRNYEVANFLVILLFLRFSRINSVTLENFNATQESKETNEHTNSTIRNRRVIKPFDSLQIKLILDLHNDYRSIQWASNMELLTWDSVLAQHALDWAKICDWSVGMLNHPNTGVKLDQKLYIGNFPGYTTENHITEAMKVFYEDAMYFTYQNKTCKEGTSCNPIYYGPDYPMIWAQTQHVGCGIHFCKTMKYNNGRNQTYIVCNYTPTGNGNVHNEPVKFFDAGPACSKCPISSETSLCKDRLCTTTCNMGNPECSCRRTCGNCAELTDNCQCKCKPGWYGEDCTEDCADKDPLCADHKMEYCNNVYDQHKCPKLCKLCESLNDKKTCVDKVFRCRNRCANGGTDIEQGGKCMCKCIHPWSGPECRMNRLEDRDGFLLKMDIEPHRFTKAFERIVQVIVDNTNLFCRKNVRKCCPEVTPQEADVLNNKLQDHLNEFEYLSRLGLKLGRGYPDYSQQPIQAWVTVKRSLFDPGCQTLCLQSQKVISNATIDSDLLKELLQLVLDKAVTEAKSCCNAKYVVISSTSAAYDENNMPYPGQATPNPGQAESGVRSMKLTAYSDLGWSFIFICFSLIQPRATVR